MIFDRLGRWYRIRQLPDEIRQYADCDESVVLYDRERDEYRIVSKEAWHGLDGEEGTKDKEWSEGVWRRD